MTEKPTYEELEKRIQELEQSEADRNQMANTLRESEERYKSLFKNNYFVMMLIDPDNADIVDANPAAISYYGWSHEELIKKKITDINIFTKEKVFQEMERAKKGHRQQFLFRHRLSNGEIRDVEVYSSPITVRGKKLLYSIIHDLSKRKKMEEELNEARQYNRGLIEANLDALVTISSKGKITDINKASELITGLPRKEIIGTDFSNYFTDPDAARKGYQQVFRDGYVRDYPLDIKHCDGKVIPVLYNASIYTDSQGNVAGVFAAARDITELKKAEEVKSARDYLEKLTSSMWDAVFSIKMPERVIEWCNDSFKLIGYEPIEYIGKTTSFLYAEPDAFLNFGNKLKNAISTGKNVLHTEELLKRKNGKIFTAEITATFNRENDEVVSVTSMIRDVTERKKMEAALQISEERLDLAIKGAGIGLWDWNIQTGETVFNERWADIVGYKLEELYPVSIDTWIDLCHPDDLKKSNALLEEHFAGKTEYYIFEDRMKHKDGHWVWVLDQGKVFEWNKEGKPLRATGTHIDITENKRAIEELKESEEKYRRLTENAKDMIYRMSLPEGVYEYVSPASIELFGYPPEKFFESPVLIQKIIHPAWIDYFKEQWANLLDGNMPPFYEYQIIHKSGETKWMNQRNVLICDDNGQPKAIEGIVTDITQNKQAEKKLRESEIKYRSMMETMKDPVYICSEDYRIEYMNHAMIRTLDRDATGEKCFEAIHGLDKICTWCKYSKIFKNECFEYNIISPKNERHYQTSNSPLVHEDGSVSQMTVFKDITDLVMIEEQYRQAQKMESVGRLAGGVAHDFNNALSVIISTTELVLDDMDPTGQLHEDLDEILMAGKRAADITRQLLAFARKQTIAPKILDLNKSVESMLKMLRRLIGEDIDLIWMPGKTLWSVKMDPSQIDQILANLCVNARDAIEGVGKLTIESRNVTFTEDYSADHEGFVQGEFVQLTISDNGCGMNKEILSNIFEPFFTTKDVDKGTGLGLATVYGIVKQNNGFINVYSEPDKGTSIKIYLSKHEDKAVEIHKEIREEIPTSKGEKVLVVEDDPAILNIMQKILEGLGYTVLTSSAPEKTMDIIKEYTGKIHLLITDVIMPKMNGHDLVEQLQPICPDLKCIFMSGYTADAIANQGVLDKEVNFIQKPFSRIDLAKIVRKVLDEN
jgi:PAS domain S-box-containing protein